MRKNYEIGQWVELAEGIGQVIFVREIFTERFTEEYFEGSKVGSYSYDVLVCKLLCDYEGKVRKKDRVIAVRDEYCNMIDKESQKLVEAIKINSPTEYREYIVSDDKADIGGSVSIDFIVPVDLIDKLKDEISKIDEALPNFFTLKEFLAVAKEKGLQLDIKQARKYVPGTGLNFSVILFNRLYKTVNKQRIYTRLWCRSR